MSSLSKSLCGLSSSLREEVMVTKKPGIVSILGSDERTNTVASLKRTLSADMSSKKWQAQHGFYPLKKIASSGELHVSITGEEEEEREGCDRHFWSSIQEDNEKEDLEKPCQFDIWSSIVSQKKQEDSNPPAPYVHPLVKRSTSSLSEKSLEICTESLGSETGSDGFSSYPPSETDDAEEDKEVEQEHQQVEEKEAQSYEMEDLQVVKYNFGPAAKKWPPRSFPPPIPSLSKRDGASVRMRSHRDNGRLVLEAVSSPSHNNFRAQRQDGRLVLAFINQELNTREMNIKNNDVEQFDVEMEIENSEIEKEYGSEDEVEEDEEEIEEEDYMEARDNERGRGEGGGEESGFVKEQAPKLSGGVISVHRLALVMNKPLALANNRNPTWPNKFNEAVKFQDGEEVYQPVTPRTQSLPPRPPVGRMISSQQAAAASTIAVAAKAAVSFNPCEYFWKPKPMAASAVPASVFNPVTQKLASSPPPPPHGTNNNFLSLSKSSQSKEQQELAVLRGDKGDYFVPLSKGCKEPRRVLFWEPHCIATS